ncbi:MAG: tRNA 2-thiocytidine biosynthesis protein TtcA [Lachnospiraceae bacterium]|nr:tRNA 2-thiocytidine biosynthesis protein TtcA [Lachnospiraceae bacterium]
MNNEDELRLKRDRINRSIQKTYHKALYTKFVQAVSDYGLIEEGDSIAVCISGGKDSMCMAKLFQEIKRHNKFPFEVRYLVMDPGYSTPNRDLILHNAELLDIPLTVFDSQIFDTVYKIDRSPCYLCARMRRGHLYAKAKEYGCNKIALGHHFDDVISTLLMGMFYSGQYEAMMPKLKSTNFEGMELIRPMYYIKESDIIKWAGYNGLTFLQCACRFSEQAARENSEDESISKRIETRKLIEELRKSNPYIEDNIFAAMSNVTLNKLLGFKYKNSRYGFLDHYDDDLDIAVRKSSSASSSLE